jgi:hypothetical protein
MNIEIHDALLAANPAVDPFARTTRAGSVPGKREWKESPMLPIFKVKRPDSSAKEEPKVK